MAADGGDIKALGVEVDQKEGMRALSVSPDGAPPGVHRGRPQREPWVLEHFLPEPVADEPSREALTRAHSAGRCVAEENIPP